MRSPARQAGFVLRRRLGRLQVERAGRRAFGIGDEAYKFEYCDVTLPLFAALIPVNLAGRLYIRRGAALAWLRGLPLWRKLRPYKWVVLRALRGGPPTGEAPTPGSD